MKRKQGISLIVLVITIIVMIILAAAVVVSLNNTGIIGKANTAVEKTNLQQVQDLASLAWADAYMDNYRGDELVNQVTTKLANSGVTAANWDITVSDTGVKVAVKTTSGANMITFIIADVSYQAEEGMTVKEWLESSYNTLGGISYDTDTNLISQDGTDMTLREKNNTTTMYAYVYGDTVITDGYETYWKNIKPSPIPS